MDERVAVNSFRAVGYSHVGQRPHNEDDYLLNDALGLMIVADGVGGHQAGEVASAITCKVLEREVSAGADLAAGIKAANSEVFAAVAQALGRSGMASTVVALRITTAGWDIAWVGDSRAYLWDGQLALLSRDHSLVERLVQLGQLSIEEARSHPKRNVIDQAVGLQGEDNLRIGRNSGAARAGQVLLLCSDGLNDVLNSQRIAEILAVEAALDQRCKALVEAAIEEGGKDNTTAILVEITRDSTAPDSGEQPDIVWRYDPASRQYSGLPERALQNALDITMDAVPDGTVLMRSPVSGDSGNLPRKSNEAQLTSSSRIPYLLVTGFVVSMAILVWLVM